MGGKAVIPITFVTPEKKQGKLYLLYPHLLSEKLIENFQRLLLIEKRFILPRFDVRVLCVMVH